ncbi:MAG: FAD binding domain-containing protein, partial [Firmicutes bacterium]|nr:FAD binding domain-containing protein [Bacillota bacterium]
MPEFLQPKTIQEALSLLQVRQNIKFLAGGTDLLVLLRAGSLSCDAVMDIKKLPELSVFAYTEAGLEIGGAVTCNQIIEADFLRGAHGA